MNWGMMRVRFVWLMLCREYGIMYNLTSFIAIVQQAIKKPLVTELLPRSSYAWGWRCERYYVQFLDIGQVTYTKRSIALNPQDGDWRWLPSKPQLKLNCIRWFFGVSGRLFALSSSDNPVGYSRAWQPVVTEMKNARYLEYLAFDNFFDRPFSCIFAEFQALARLRCEAPSMGRGILYPTAVFV
jgi:hypothetical protein